jgi:murein DD-endopeptidase MepM/ murein hydrolase activator NlpD
MNIIILSDKLSAPRRIALTGKRLTLVAVAAVTALATLTGLAFIGGTRLGMSQQAAGAEVQKLRQQLAQYESGLIDVREASQRDLNALALRLGELKAEATRLNALGERLIALGKLDQGEFNFSEPPALGGPQTLPQVGGLEPEDFLRSLGELERQFAEQATQLSLIEEFLLGRDIERDLTPAGWPIKQGYISSSFGYRSDPFTGGRDLHTGIDFPGNFGDDIYAVADGVVAFSGMHFGYGNMVEIDHGNGYRTRYAHHSRNLVKVGDVVKTGQKIAEMGRTGRATGVHLHFEVWHNDRPVNPLTFVRTTREARQSS